MTTQNTTSGWRTVTLGDYSKIYQPKTITSKQILKEGPFKVYGANGVIGYYDKYNHENSEVLVTCRGATCGKMNFSEPQSWITGNAMVIQPFDEQVLDKNFLYLQLLHGHLESLNTGSAQPQITKGPLFNFSIGLPIITEQKAIARTLTTVQDAIAEQEKLIAKFKELKRSMMQHLFTHGTKGEKTKITEIGEIPESWEVVGLGTNCKPLNGFAFKSADYVSSGILNFRVANIASDGSIRLNSIEYLPESYAEKYREYLLRENDILLVMVGATRGKLTKITKEVLPALTNQNMWRFSVTNSNKLSQDYLYYFLTWKVPKIIDQMSDSTRGFFKKDDFNALLIGLPSMTEQAIVVKAFTVLDEQIATTQAKLSAYQNLFKTLLHELMSGERRIKNI